MRVLAWQCAHCNAFNATDRVKCGKCTKDKKVKIIFWYGNFFIYLWTTYYNGIQYVSTKLLSRLGK